MYSCYCCIVEQTIVPEPVPASYARTGNKKEIGFSFL